MINDILIFTNGLVLALGFAALWNNYRLSKAATGRSDGLSEELKQLLSDLSESHNQISANQAQLDQSLTEARQTLAGMELRMVGGNAPTFRKGK